MDVPNTFVPGTTIKSQEMNANFASLLPTPGARTVSTLGGYLDNNVVFNVLDYAAGGSDDTTQIQNAIADATLTGGLVLLPIKNSWTVSGQLVLPAGVQLMGYGSGYGTTNTCLINWLETTDFCIKMGNTAGTLSYGMGVSNLRISAPNGGSGIWMYGAAHSAVRNVDIEGPLNSPTLIGVQIDGANISSFFVALENIQCNHVFKGFVHTTTGTTKPTQVLGTNCSALCDDTAGSKGIDIQNIAGVGMGDGVTYIGGNMEACETGVYLNGSGTTIVGMRFENSHATGTDIVFDTLARCNQIIGGANVYSISNLAGSRTNQVIGVPKDQSGVVSQQNLLDQMTVAGDTPLLFPVAGAGTNAISILLSAAASFAGSLFLQAGNRSAGFGGSLTMYGHAHATHAGDVVAGLSSGSASRKFRVNTQALDGGTDVLTVDGASGDATITGLLTSGSTTLHKTSVALSNGAGASAGTLTNAPAVGNPTKWIPINDNGTTRYIPAW